MAEIKRCEYICSNCQQEATLCSCIDDYRRYSIREWDCDNCKRTVASHGGRDTECTNCGAQYNGSGQRLVDDWRGNPSLYNDDIGDMEGHEIQHSVDVIH